MNIETTKALKQQLLDELSNNSFTYDSLVRITNQCTFWINENIDAVPALSFYHVYAIRDICFSISNFIEGQEPNKSASHSAMEEALLGSLKAVITNLDCDNSDEKYTSLAELVITFEKLKH